MTGTVNRFGLGGLVVLEVVAWFGAISPSDTVSAFFSAVAGLISNGVNFAVTLEILPSSPGFLR